MTKAHTRNSAELFLQGAVQICKWNIDENGYAASILEGIPAGVTFQPITPDRFLLRWGNGKIRMTRGAYKRALVLGELNGVPVFEGEPITE